MDGFESDQTSTIFLMLCFSEAGRFNKKQRRRAKTKGDGRGVGHGLRVAEGKKNTGRRDGKQRVESKGRGGERRSKDGDEKL
ncbi:unnamed protein product [Prunus armeniaca]|uniref:Uncharacterized protein n=1 Tax=Prunus armeniaca TaxID=36596 RepID=A0A6J5V0E3_PRUAR|nr:unnamed protein product [Prunus armeniaca]CAB4312798.1 unnamed protein product [Prunus armeniaca]